MPLYSQLEGTGSSVGTVEGSAGARMVSRILLRVLLSIIPHPDRVNNLGLGDREVGEASADRADDPYWSL
ncbi:hypothetical protein Tco_0245257 [Tanacetum coccineum]